MKLPVRLVDEENKGSQEGSIPIVDSRPGKKQTRAGRKRKDSRKGRYSRKGMEEESRREELTNMNDSSIAILPTKAQMAGQKAVENVIDEDPILEAEIIVPLNVNQLPDDGHVLIPEMVHGMKLWDTQESCNGGMCMDVWPRMHFAITCPGTVLI